MNFVYKTKLPAELYNLSIIYLFSQFQIAILCNNFQIKDLHFYFEQG